MPSLSARILLAVIGGLQLLILAFRFPRCRHRAELVWFFLLIACILGRQLPAGGVILQVLSGYLLVWILASYLALVADRERNLVLYLVLAGLGGMHFVLGLMGLLTTLPFLILSVFFLVLFSGFPLWILFDLYRKSRFWLFLYFLAAAALFVAALGYEIMAAGTVLPIFRPSYWLSLAALLGTGHLLVHESYLRGEGLQGFFARLVLQERRLQTTYSRLVQTEATLLLQDRLIAAGVLAAGAVHEFKNTLATIASAAEFGLAAAKRGGKDESLALIREQAALGRKSVAEFLDRLVEQGCAEPDCVRVREDIKPVLNLLRSGLRREGIRLTCEVEAGAQCRVRKGELEQVLLNLIRNASDNLKSRTEQTEKLISVKVRREAEKLILDVVDNGGGVPTALGDSIFNYAVSEKQSTGLGLYLARLLVERNGGSLEYLPMRQGSCFRMVFSAAD